MFTAFRSLSIQKQTPRPHPYKVKQHTFSAEKRKQLNKTTQPELAPDGSKTRRTVTLWIS
jgi:hypothetical protein